MAPSRGDSFGHHCTAPIEIDHVYFQRIFVSSLPHSLRNSGNHRRISRPSWSSQHQLPAASARGASQAVPRRRVAARRVVYEKLGSTNGRHPLGRQLITLELACFNSYSSLSVPFFRLLRHLLQTFGYIGYWCIAAMLTPNPAVSCQKPWIQLQLLTHHFRFSNIGPVVCYEYTKVFKEAKSYSIPTL